MVVEIHNCFTRTCWKIFYTFNSEKSHDKWCLCKMSDDEDHLNMYESKTCQIQWFHIKCMRIKKIPKGKWFCVKCKIKKKKRKKAIQAMKNIRKIFQLGLCTFLISTTFASMYMLKFFKMLALSNIIMQSQIILLNFSC